LFAFLSPSTTQNKTKLDTLLPTPKKQTNQHQHNNKNNKGACERMGMEFRNWGLHELNWLLALLGGNDG